MKYLYPPISKLSKISNPSSFSIYTKLDKYIIFLGDQHTSYKGKNCKEPCSPPSCYTYISLIETLDTYHKNQDTDLDVYLETFKPTNPKQFLSRFKISAITYIDQIFRNVLDSSLHLTEVRKHFLKKVYFHNKKDVHQRYHYMDIRYEPMFKKNHISFIYLLQLMYISIRKEKYAEKKMKHELNMFFKKYPSISSFYTQMSYLCFKDKHSIITKQYKKLNKQDQSLINSFFHSFLKKKKTFYKKIWSRSSKQRTHFVMGILEISAFLTDIYTLCRFLRFFHTQPKGSTSIFITGAAHSNNYIAFMKHWKAKTLIRKHVAKKNSKCISI
jgi:hypothetical protein